MLDEEQIAELKKGKTLLKRDAERGKVEKAKTFETLKNLMTLNPQSSSDHQKPGGKGGAVGKKGNKTQQAK